ncbi:Fe-S cluster assembly sulfur transfer protein SufU [Deinococcus koreensis]|uniref:SUF system NifU family Fe-S cluster assembly protein n=1 Tax=Deinococcus koreensis TaxID=2054903 RepID=A0A2K3UW01_9DEIO|nr:SUF system NifU family Fe-S cluster assembly protein [Deinococcus koreensis]PNY80708.1 SUF system NifU family Fe-S cluster assembly protein [Deinococcus koreensis]
MSALQAMYKQVIMEHSRKPRNAGELPGATHTGEGHNPSCGDGLRLQLQLEGDTIRDVHATATGCAISVASASLMTVALRGRTVAQARETAQAFTQMIRTGEADAALGDLMALQGVHTLHTRVKCATLPWQTLDVLLSSPTDTQP